MLRRLSIALVLATLGCNDPGTATPPPSPSSASPEVAGLPDGDPALAHRLVEQEGALLLDVRSDEEFSEGHIEGARHIPHTEVASRIEEIRQWTDGKTDAPIVVYCRAGRRAGIAKEALVEAGFTQVTNLGGMSDW